MTIKNYEEDYEGEMAKNTLKKLIAFSTELLPMIEDDQQLPAWLQDKFSKLDYYINSVYSYMKFSEIQRQEMENENSEMEESEEMDEESEEMDEESEDAEEEEVPGRMELEVKLDSVIIK